MSFSSLNGAGYMGESAMTQAVDRSPLATATSAMSGALELAGRISQMRSRLVGSAPPSSGSVGPASKAAGQLTELRDLGEHLLTQIQQAHTDLDALDRATS